LDGHKEFVQIDPNDLFPYLLVNIGSGVSMIKVINLVYSYWLLPCQGINGENFGLAFFFRLSNSLWFLFCRWMGTESFNELVGQALGEAPFGAWGGF